MFKRCAGNVLARTQTFIQMTLYYQHRGHIDMVFNIGATIQTLCGTLNVTIACANNYLIVIHYVYNVLTLTTVQLL